MKFEISDKAASDFDRLLAEVVMEGAGYELMRVKMCQHRLETSMSRNQRAASERARDDLDEALVSLSERTRATSRFVTTAMSRCDNPECGQQHRALLVGLA